MTVYIRGDRALEAMIRRCRSNGAPFLKRRVVIAEFERSGEVEASRHLAARISARAKAQAFRRAGLLVDLPYLSLGLSAEGFLAQIKAWNAEREIIGVVLQRPVLPHLISAMECLAPEKDLDAAASRSGEQISATAEAACRVVEAFATPDDLVAVVGGRGNVGSHVVLRLDQTGLPYRVVDLGDPLTEVREASIVVSAVGKPGLIDQKFASPRHRLFVDIGFTPISLKPRVLRGDVSPDAYPPNGYVTPVPGGVGPLQISVLLERIWPVATGRILPPWTVTGDILD